MEEEIRRLLKYCPDTGFLYWRFKYAGIAAGALAGWSDNIGYCYVMIGQRQFMAHRVVWLLHYGSWPNEFEEIDKETSTDMTDKRDAEAAVILIGIKSLLFCIIGAIFITIDAPIAVAVCAIWATIGAIIILLVDA